MTHHTRIPLLNLSRPIYAFLLFPPFFAADPLVAAVPSPSIKALSSSINSSSPGATEPASRVARLGSNFPMTGTLEARRVWKGRATKWPFSSNHSVKERASVKFWGLLDDFEVRVMVRL